MAIATDTLCFSASESTVGHAAKYARFAADSALASVPLVIGEGNTESGGKLLSHRWTSHVVSLAIGLMSAHTNPDHWQHTGCGSIRQKGGWANVSDVFISALWVLDWLPQISKAGAVRQNFHGGPVRCTLWSPFATMCPGTSKRSLLASMCFYSVRAFVVQPIPLQSLARPADLMLGSTI